METNSFLALCTISDDTGMFWGIQYYNDMLLSSGRNGNVQTEMILHKDAGNFTFNEGWAFPRKISFNGDECVMPSPEDYPSLPNKAYVATPTSSTLLFSVFVLSILLLEWKGFGIVVPHWGPLQVVVIFRAVVAMSCLLSFDIWIIINFFNKKQTENPNWLHHEYECSVFMILSSKDGSWWWDLCSVTMAIIVLYTSF